VNKIKQNNLYFLIYCKTRQNEIQLRHYTTTVFTTSVTHIIIKSSVLCNSYQMSQNTKLLLLGAEKSQLKHGPDMWNGTHDTVHCSEKLQVTKLQDTAWTWQSRHARDNSPHCHNDVQLHVTYTDVT